MNPAFLDDMSWAMAEVYAAVTDRIMINLARHFPYIKDADEIAGMGFPAYLAGTSPLKSTRCPYIPTCSQYGLEAIEKYGALKGGLLALWRIIRCNPFSHGGFDPVP